MSIANVDPALHPLVETFPPIDLSAETLAPFRAAVQDMSAMPDPATHPDVRIEEVSAQGIRCLLYRPMNGGLSGALLHIHGGGFLMGLPEMDAARNIALARATGCVILSVDYRLAPEHPYPAGLMDCHSALMWLSTQARQLGFAPHCIGVVGESAGGGLAAGVALLARDHNSVALACQILIYPMLVPPQQSIAPAADTRTGRFIWTRTSNTFAWSAYLAGSTLPNPSLSDLPPTFIAVGDLDLFVHDNLAYASGLIAAGCAVETHLYPGAIHAFDRAVDAPVSVRYASELTNFIRLNLQSPK